MVWDCCGSRVRNQLGLGRRLGKDEKDSKDAGTATTYWAWSWGAVFGCFSVKVGGAVGAPQPLSGCAKTLCTIHYPIQRINNSCMDGERFANM